MRWWMTRRVERQATRMHELLEHLNVDSAALVRANQGDVYMQARTRCITCGTSDKCLRWLDSERTHKQPPEFCPNLSTFQQFLRPAGPDRT
jgi:hypothetical protein